MLRTVHAEGDGSERAGGRLPVAAEIPRVHIAARVMALAASDEVLVSRTVKDLVAGSGLAFSDRGTHELKSVPDTWQIYRAGS